MCITTAAVLSSMYICIYIVVISTAAMLFPCFLHCFFNISAVGHRAGSSPPPTIIVKHKKEHCLLIVRINTAAVLSSMYVFMYACIYSNFYCSVILIIFSLLSPAFCIVFSIFSSSRYYCCSPLLFAPFCDA